MSTPKEQWQITDALVYSADWVPGNRNDYEHYVVVYSYRVGNDRYTSEFRDYIKEPDTPLHRNDVISIRYCPQHPAKSFYPNRHSGTNKLLLFLAIEAGIALIILSIIYFSGGFR